MTTVSLELHIQSKYKQFAFLNGSYFESVSMDITWDEFFTFVADPKTKKNLKECGFVITKHAGRGRCREHPFSEKIQEFIKTFSTIREIYTVCLRRDEGIGSSDPSTNEDDFSRYVHLTFSQIPPPPPMSYGGGSGVLKRVSEQDYDNKPAKSPRLCEASLGTPTPADNLENVQVVPVDGNESNASSDLLRDSEEKEVQAETGRLNAEDFNPNLEGNDKTKDQGLRKLQDESSVAGGVLGENDRGNYYEDAEGNQYGNIQDVETTNEEDVNNDKNPQINSATSQREETEIQNLNEIDTIMEVIDDDENENAMDLNEMDRTILSGIGGAEGQLNRENSEVSDKETSNQRGVEQMSESIVKKQEDENDDVEIVYVKNKSDGRPSGKKKTEGPNSDGQEEKCESKADLNILKAENIKKEESLKMATVKLKLRIRTKYAQLPFFEELNGLTATVSKAFTWDKFFTFIADAKTSEELKTFGFGIKKSARGRCREHPFSEKIEEFINTFSEKQDIYTVYLRKYSPHFKVPRKSKLNPNPIDGEISLNLCLPPRSPAMSHGGGSGVLKRVSLHDHHDDKPVKSSRLCDAPLGTPADNPDEEMDASESNASSELLKDVEENEGQSKTGSLNAEDFNANFEGNGRTKYLEGNGGEVGEVQDESSVAGGVLGENVSRNLVQVVGAGGNGGNNQDAEIKNISFVEDVRNDKSETQVQNSYELGTSVKEVNDEGQGNSMDQTILIRIGGADGKLNENSEGIDKEPDNQGGVEQIIPENPIVIKQEDENDDVETKEVINKSDGRSSGKKEAEVPNLDGQEGKCERKVDINNLKAENIKKEDKFEEGKSKLLQELKNLSNDDFQAFQTELKQLESMQGKSRTILRGKAKHTLFFLFEFVMGSQNLQECSEEVQNKLKDSRVEKISEEIKRLFDEKELGNILSPDLAFFLMDSFC